MTELRRVTCRKIHVDLCAILIYEQSYACVSCKRCKRSLISLIHCSEFSSLWSLMIFSVKCHKDK